MSRGERRARTERIATRRHREVQGALMGGVSESRQHIRGMARTRSLFDCGKTQCGVCRVNAKDFRKKRARKEMPDSDFGF